MGRSKYDIDLDALFSVRVLMSMGKITNWREAGLTYSLFTGEEVPESNLRSYCEKIVGKEINTRVVEKYIASYKEKTKVELDYDPNKQMMIENTVVDFQLDNGAKTVQVGLGITNEQMQNVFGVNDNDDGITKKEKLLRRLSDDQFLLQQLGFNPKLYEVDKVDIGAWTTPMKLKIDDNYLPIIVTNDRLMVNIKKKMHIQRDYDELSTDLVSLFKEAVETIEYPKYKKLKRLKGYEDKLLTKHIGDLHAGGLTHWTETSLDNWDSKKASSVYNSDTEYTIQKQQEDWRARTLLMVINGDISDVDNYFNKTSSMSNHTMQTDSRWNKMLNDRISNILYSLVLLSPHFEQIFFKVNRGNHDQQTSDAIYITVATTILMSKIKNVFPDYDDSALMKESIFTWGKHLFISDHGELSDKVLYENLKVKYGDLMRQYPYVNITANHMHQMGMTQIGDATIFREPALCPVTGFEAKETRLNGTANMAQTYKLWEKEKRIPQIYTNEFERKSLWRDQDVDSPKNGPGNMEELHMYLFENDLMKPTFKQIETARFYKAKIETAKEVLSNRGVDTSKMTREELIQFVEDIGVELPVELRTQNKEFVISNMDRILGETPKQRRVLEKVK